MAATMKSVQLLDREGARHRVMALRPWWERYAGALFPSDIYAGAILTHALEIMTTGRVEKKLMPALVRAYSEFLRALPRDLVAQGLICAAPNPPGDALAEHLAMRDLHRWMTKWMGEFPELKGRALRDLSVRQLMLHFYWQHSLCPMRPQNRRFPASVESLAPESVYSITRENSTAAQEYESTQISEGIGHLIKWGNSNALGKRGTLVTKEDVEEVRNELWIDHPLSALYKGKDGSWKLDARQMVSKLRDAGRFSRTAAHALESNADEGEGTVLDPVQAADGEAVADGLAVQGARARIREILEGESRRPAASNLVKAIRAHLLDLMLRRITQQSIVAMTGASPGHVSRALSREIARLKEIPELAEVWAAFLD